MKSLSERLNFKDNTDKENAVKINNKKDINIYDTLCVYCADNDINLDKISDSDFNGAVMTIENYGSANCLESDYFYFWIDNEMGLNPKIGEVGSYYDNTNFSPMETCTVILDLMGINTSANADCPIKPECECDGQYEPNHDNTDLVLKKCDCGDDKRPSWEEFTDLDNSVKNIIPDLIGHFNSDTIAEFNEVIESGDFEDFEGITETWFFANSTITMRIQSGNIIFDWEGEVIGKPVSVLVSIN